MDMLHYKSNEEKSSLGYLDLWVNSVMEDNEVTIQVSHALENGSFASIVLPGAVDNECKVSEGIPFLM